MYNINSGYGAKVMEALHNAYSQGGKVFMVAKSAAAGRQILQELFDIDPEGINRYAATVDAAIGYTAAARGDVILIAPGHTETIATAAAVAQDVAGVSIFGLGQGNNRPVFTFSATGATWAISADNCALKNIIGVPSVDSVVNPFNVTGDNPALDIEWQDASTSVEALRAIRLDTANNAVVKLKYLGFTGGDATANAIRIDDCDNVRIEIDVFGRVDATGWVEMVDVASTNVYVNGKTFCQAVTNGSRNVIDTITGSSWFAEIKDMSAGASYSGGSAAALASDDASAIASAQLVPSADAVTNTNSRDVIGNKTDAAIADTIEGAAATTQSLVADVKAVLQRLGADSANNTAATSLTVANKDGSVLERLEALMDPLGGYDPVLGFRVTKTSAMADGSGTDNLFTVTGRCLITHLSGEVTTVIGTTTTMKIRDVTNSVDLCAATTITTDAVGTMYSLTSITANILNGTGATPVIGSVPNITGALPMPMAIVGDVQAPLTIAHVLDGAGTGAVAWVLYYKPLTAASSIVAAA